MKLPLCGIIPPVITPLLDNNTIDVQGLERLIEHLISGGVHGLYILGTMGEATSLSYILRKELIKRTCELAGHRVPVLAGITDTSFNGSLEIAEYGYSAGLDAVVIAPPYYIPLAQEEMTEYLENLAPRLPLPFLMYDMPGYTKIHLSVATLKRARELGAIGVKDSSGDMSYLLSLIYEFKSSPGFSVLCGTELFLPDAVLGGAHGAVPGGANIFPKLFVSLYEAALARDLDKIITLRDKVMMIEKSIYSVGKYKSGIIKGIKCSLSVMNICNDYLALPLSNFRQEERKKIEQYIFELKQIMD